MSCHVAIFGTIMDTAQFPNRQDLQNCSENNNIGAHNSNQVTHILMWITVSLMMNNARALRSQLHTEHSPLQALLLVQLSSVELIPKYRFYSDYGTWRTVSQSHGFSTQWQLVTRCRNLIFTEILMNIKVHVFILLIQVWYLLKSWLLILSIGTWICLVYVYNILYRLHYNLPCWCHLHNY